MGEAEDTVRKRIRESGRITFAEFMALALYGPGGYYTQGRPIGAAGDYYTSPAAHPVFGALLALQLEQMWTEMGKPERFDVIGAGAGDGTLAADIMDYVQALDPAFAKALHYVAADGHPRPARPGNGHVRWVQAGTFPFRGIAGCILSNELVDSLPVHRVRMHGGRIQELYLQEGGAGLKEEWGAPSSPAILARLDADGAVLDEGWEGEVNLAAAAWIEEAAGALTRGYVLTIDYGDTADLLYTAERSRGTVSGYYRHTQAEDLYARIGRQDLTAHANFTTLIEAAKPAGLQPVSLMTQAEFLRNLGIEAFFQRLAEEPLERQANLAAVTDLVKPEGLGRFRVLLQAKDAPARRLGCLRKDPGYTTTLWRRLPDLPAPRLSARHINVVGGQYPHQQETWVEGSWEELLGGDDPGGDPRT